MGWFNKEQGDIPELPELPKFPELPSESYKKNNYEGLPQLPTIPSSKLGERFSQNLIKEAVTGEKEDNVEEEFEEEEKPLITPPRLNKPLTQEIPVNLSLPIRRETRERFREPPKRIKEEPIFIRIDKFEESLKIFETTKNRISEVEKMLRDIKRIKEAEEKELIVWEEELQNLKNQIERVNEDIFSKIE